MENQLKNFSTCSYFCFMSKYYKLILPIEGEEYQENAIAVLHFKSNFESVLQEAHQLIFSYDISNQSKDELKEILSESNLCSKWDIEDEPEINWNEQYEKSFQPITILDDLWGVRASFHPKLNVKHEIVIDPKMSFGTGHHETTKQVMEMLTNIDLKGKNVWDYGSGTGILAIMAEMLGANNIKANDNEEWAYNNSLENAEINHCTKIKFQLGDIDICEQNDFLNSTRDQFDIIIANITKNILLDSAFKINQYSQNGTSLVLSGFYQEDIIDIEKKYKEYHFTISSKTHLNNWVCLHLIKNL